MTSKPQPHSDVFLRFPATVLLLRTLRVQCHPSLLATTGVPSILPNPTQTPSALRQVTTRLVVRAATGRSAAGSACEALWRSPHLLVRPSTAHLPGVRGLQTGLPPKGSWRPVHLVPLGSSGREKFAAPEVCPRLRTWGVGGQERAPRQFHREPPPRGPGTGEGVAPGG